MTDKEIVESIENILKEASKMAEATKIYPKSLFEGIYPEILEFINRQQEQLEAAIAGQETLQKALAEKDREVERLNNNISAMAVTMHNCAKATRAEAIRAFAERLKSFMALNKQVSNESFYYITTDIDNLVKEMVGDTE